MKSLGGFQKYQITACYGFVLASFYWKLFISGSNLNYIYNRKCKIKVIHNPYNNPNNTYN